MLDRTQAEGLLLRVAVAALNYYPDKPTDEPGYQLAEDIDWCLDALPALFEPFRDAMAQRLTEVITDPVTYRQGFVRDILDLTTPVATA